jgi:hypothetical protein
MAEVTTPTAERASGRQPGDDEEVAAHDDLTVLTFVRGFYDTAKDAKRSRSAKNRANWRAYHAEGDWSHKQKGQSKEYLPKVAMAIEQFSSFIKRALVSFGDYFDVELPDGPLLSRDARKLLMSQLEDCGPPQETGDRADFATVIADGVKTGALGSLIILKIHGCMKAERNFAVERGLELTTVNGLPAPQVTENLTTTETTTWKLMIDLVRAEDYFPDPTGKGLGVIHEVERDLYDVIEWAEYGIYDKQAVAQIEEDFQRQEDEAERARAANQDPVDSPGFRKRVVIREYWGTLLDSKGKVVKKNIVTTVANDKYLIRKPTANPNWHQESPFVAAPLIRVPFSVWHKAMADHMTSLNMAQNEMFNLILDGGLASVWGTRQLHTNWLENPSQVSDGIPQGATLQVNDQCPPQGKVLETVTTGQVPPDAQQTYANLEREFQAASLTNEIALGMLPAKQVKATEVVSADQSRGMTLDSIVRDVENMLIRPALRKAWLCLLQYADDLAADDIVAAIGPRAALALGRMSPPERFAKYASGTKFRVFGLSALMTRQRDFQKYAALLGLVTTNPLMLQAFAKKYSFTKVLDTAMKTLNIDPATIEADEIEQGRLAELLKEMPMWQAAAGVKTQGGGGMSSAETGDGATAAQVDQLMTNPTADYGR